MIMYTDTRHEYAMARAGIVTRGIKVGDPVTLTLWSDTRAAVVTRVTAKTITVARVETGPSRPDMASDTGAYGLRPTLADGILSEPIPGSAQRFTWTRNAWRNGSTRAVLGHSVSRVDWRD